MDKDLHIAELIAKKHREGLGPAEQAELDSWLNEDPVNREIFELTGDPGRQREKLDTYALFDQDKAASRLEDELFGKKTVRLNARTFLRYAATLLLPMLMIGGAAWWFLGNSKKDLIAEIDTHISPGNEKAVLVLSDGSQIALDTKSLTEEFIEGDAIIQGEDNTLRYQTEAGEEGSKTLVYNELITPKGGSYQLSLADGSRIWLNAGSSLRFPVSFHDSVRRVYLEGEAYFEVQPSSKAFLVQSGALETRVLGTSFNIAAYQDDDLIQTTLVEGKVLISGKAESGSLQKLFLDPNEQAQWEVNSAKLTRSEVDASGYTSWVRGKLEFHQESLEQVMKRLSRWYDFEYQFENEAARELCFSARLDRSARISEILDMLAMTTEVRFEYKANKILVY